MAAVLTTPKPRARVTQIGDVVYVRFPAKPAAEVRDRLKARGAQFIARRGAWALPLAPTVAR